jgi:lysozyme family protein
MYDREAGSWDSDTLMQPSDAISARTADVEHARAAFAPSQWQEAFETFAALDVTQTLEADDPD